MSLKLSNVTRIYEGKTSEQTVRALDHVSVDFGDTGLVFLLGRSGSGKSTMLNSIGGLDEITSGSIVFKDKDIRDFRGDDFDSYRNTYVGFIFQDYNILDEFTVSKNIALALELQGKKATDAVIEGILDKVDLAGLGDRKPNQLSGGQKQRVAIARALIKEPEIIMADEPTGALDSRTGHMVFETLAKLGKERLVIVVSHDRGFAEQYGDRIIEMADGKVISDVVKRKIQGEVVASNVVTSGDALLIKPGVELSKEDESVVLAFVKKRAGKGLVVSGDGDINDKIKRLAKMDDNGGREYFDTTQEQDTKPKREQTQFRPIKSKFRYGDSLKMGLSGLAKKKIRLVFTILLASLALTFFAIADAAGSFDKVKSMYDSVRASGNQTLAISTDYTVIGSGYGLPIKTRESTLTDLREEYPGMSFVTGYDIPFGVTYKKTAEVSGAAGYYPYSMNQSFFLTPGEYQQFGLSLLAGNYPQSQNQIVISDYMADCFVDLGLKTGNPNDSTTQQEYDIAGYQDLLGKPLPYSSNGRFVKDYEIVGVVDTRFDFAYFAPLKEEGSGYDLSGYLLSNQLVDLVNFGFAGGAFFASDEPLLRESLEMRPTSLNGFGYGLPGGGNAGFGLRVSSIAIDKNVSEGILRFDGGQELGKQDIVIEANDFSAAMGQAVFGQEIEFLGKPINFAFHDFYWQGRTTDDTQASWIEVPVMGVSGSYYDEEGVRTDFAYALQEVGAYLSEISKAESLNIGVVGFYDGEGGIHKEPECYEPIEDGLGGTNYDWGTVIEECRLIGQAQVAKAMQSSVQAVGVALETMGVDLSIPEIALPNDLQGNAQDTGRLQLAGILVEPLLTGVVGGGVYKDCITVSGQLVESIPVLDDLLAYRPYNAVLTQLGTSRANDHRLLARLMNYRAFGEHQVLHNQYSSTYQSFAQMIETVATIFLYLGLGFAVFAALLISNFISLTVTSKKKEIGILRAIGAKRGDVYKIFFNESLAIGIINFLVASLFGFVAVTALGIYIAGAIGMKLVLLKMGLRQFGLVLLISLAVVTLASLWPTLKISKLKPLDAIQDRK
ncbi:MAG: ATP-binding cassette domain-containing protein [Firmicutes bacterium]|nr:ATP-binding cassette domain-containing protein [Bacillota bacterium]